MVLTAARRYLTLTTFDLSVTSTSDSLRGRNAIRSPAMLVLLLILVAYALATGDVARRLGFQQDLAKRDAGGDRSGVLRDGCCAGVMIAYGAYVPGAVSLMRATVVVGSSMVLVSLLATLMIFPLVYRYGLNPAISVSLKRLRARWICESLSGAQIRVRSRDNSWPPNESLRKTGSSS